MLINWSREKLLADKDEELDRLKDDINNLESERSSLISKVSFTSSCLDMSIRFAVMFHFLLPTFYSSDLVTNALVILTLLTYMQENMLPLLFQRIS